MNHINSATLRERMVERPALPGSYERLCHEAGSPRFLLPLRGPAASALGNRLLAPRLERAIGVIYLPKMSGHIGNVLFRR